MNDAPDLRGRTVIVTGASSGIGAATARALHAAGAQPVLAARRTQRLDALSAQLGGALSVQTDVTDADQVAVLVAAALDRHGRIDALVNNAGVSLHDETIEQLDLDQFHRVLDLNVVSVIRLMQAVLPAMRRQGFGRIVNISSGTTGMVIPGVGAYAATKSAVNMLSAVARKELEGIGVPDGRKRARFEPYRLGRRRLLEEGADLPVRPAWAHLSPVRSEPMSEPRRMMPWRRTTTRTAVARRPHCGNVRRISDTRGVRRPAPGRNGKAQENGVPAGTNEEPGETTLRPTVRWG